MPGRTSTQGTSYLGGVTAVAKVNQGEGQAEPASKLHGPQPTPAHKKKLVLFRRIEQI